MSLSPHNSSGPGKNVETLPQPSLQWARLHGQGGYIREYSWLSFHQSLDLQLRWINCVVNSSLGTWTVE